MKKILLLGCLCLTMLCGGLFLSACGQSSFLIKCTCQQQDLVYTVVKQVENGNQTEIILTDNAYKVSKNTNVRIEFHATSFGVDMSNLQVKVNGQNKEVQLLSTFNSLDKDGDLNYGYILLPLVDKDQTVVVDGVETYKNTFKFEAAGMEDELTAQRLKSASISATQNAEDFVNFYDFLQQGGTIDFNLFGQGQNFERMFWFKFESGNPYNLTNSAPFMLKANAEEEENQPLKNVYFSSGTGLYTVELQDVGGAKESTILVDFANLQCQQYEFDLPENNLTYTASLQSPTSTIESENVLTVTKLLDETSASYNNILVCLNNKVLTPQEVLADKNTYLIEKGLTPYTTGSDTERYSISISGVEYLKNTNTVSAHSIEDVGNPFIVPQIFEVDENGEKTGVLNFNENGEQITFSGTKNALAWEYEVTEDGYYITKYDLYDYDVYLNDNFVVNLKEALAEAGEENFEKVFEDGTVLQAEFNATTQKFDSFKVLFTASLDCAWEFRNFVPNEKQVDVGFNFSLADNVTEVCFAVVDSVEVPLEEAAWQVLESGIAQRITVTTGKLVMFRVQIKEPVADFTYMIKESVAFNGYEDTLTYSEGENMYLLYRCYISNYFLDETYPVPMLQLILSASKGV